MKKVKKIFAAVMAAALAVTSIMPVIPASAEQENTGEYLLNLDFDSLDDASGVIGLKPEYAWIAPGESQLSYVQDDYEYLLRFPLSEAMDLEGTDKYEIKLRFKMPYDNYRLLGMSNGNPSNTVLYPAMASGFLALCRYSFPNTNESDMSLDDKTGIGSASSDEWRTATITYDNGNITLEVVDEKATGNVTSTTSTTLAALTGSESFQHRPGTTYDHLLLGHLSKGQKLSLDYIRVKKTTGSNTPIIPDEPAEGTIADFEFDGNDRNDSIIIGSYSSSYAWIRPGDSQLALVANPYEQPVYLTLNEDIDLSSDKIYTIEMRYKGPIDNYRFFALTNGTNNGLMYSTMMNNFLLGNTTDGVNNLSKKVQIAHVTEGIGSSAADEWKTLKYTFSKNYYELQATVERGNGNVTSVTSGSLSSLTSTGGDGKHVDGRVYDSIALANTYSTTEMTVDYVKAYVTDDDLQNPWTPREYYDPDDNAIRTNITESDKVRIIGRGEIAGDGSRTFNWSSSGFEFSFTGTYAEVFVSDCAGKSYFNVSTDGSEPERMALYSGWNTIVSGLDNKEHTIMVTRSSSAQHGTIKVQKIRSDGQPVATKEPERKIEFIGDSYTTGYGNIGGADSESAETTDSRQSYAGYVANKFNAEETLIAYAGRGVVKGYSPDSTYEMPVQFGLEEIYMDWGGAGRNMSTGILHDFSKNVPQYVVVWLGTNDYANSVNAEEFGEKYEIMLRNIRAKYPEAAVLCLTKVSEGYPSQVQRAIENVGGENSKFYYEAIDNFSASSIGHPSVAEAKVIGEEVYQRLKGINDQLKIWKIEGSSGDDTPEEPTDGTHLLNLNFDSLDEASGVIGLKPEYAWIAPGESQLSYVQDGAEYLLRFPLSEAMDLEGTDKYEIKLRFKMPYDNYRMLGLSNGNPSNPVLYSAMASGFLVLCRYSFPNPNESDMSLDDKTGIGSASSDEWRTATITYDNGNITLEVVDEKATGNVTSTTSTTLAALTGSANFQHRPGTTYDHLLLGHLSTGQKLLLDYIRVTKIPTKAPHISTVTAFAGNIEQTNVDVTTTALKINFTEEMDAESLEGAVTLTDKQGNGISAAGELTEDKKTYTLTLNEALQSSTAYILKIAATAKSAAGTSLAEAYEKNLYVANPNALLEIDYDNNAPEIEKFGTASGTPEATIKSEENGNKYAEIQANWASGGYSFLSEIVKEDKEYRVKFDFASKNTRTDYSWMLVDKSTLGAVSDDSHYHQFGLLSAGTGYGVYSDGDTYMKEFRINDTVVPGIEYAEDKWFTYDLTFNPQTRAYSLTISERDNMEITGNLSGTLKDEVYGKGMMSNRTYDAFKIGYNGTVCLDNILVERASGTPILSESGVSFKDLNGNVVTDFNSVSPATTSIILDFNQSMNVATADGKISIVNKTTGQTVNFGISASGTTLILGVANLTPGSYKLTVSNGIASVAGNAMNSDFSCDFTVRNTEQTASLENVLINGNEVKTLAELTDGDAEVTVNVTNTKNEPVQYSVIVAYYDTTNKLIDVSETKIPVSAGFEGEKTVPITIAKTADTNNVSIMLWKSLTVVTPCSGSLKFW